MTQGLIYLLRVVYIQFLFLIATFKNCSVILPVGKQTSFPDGWLRIAKAPRHCIPGCFDKQLELQD